MKNATLWRGLGHEFCTFNCGSTGVKKDFFNEYLEFTLDHMKCTQFVFQFVFDSLGRRFDSQAKAPDCIFQNWASLGQKIIFIK